MSELEKRIAELEEKVRFWQGEAGRWADAFGIERQRRESAEAALRPFKYPGLYPNKYEQEANAHFSRFPHPLPGDHP